MKFLKIIALMLVLSFVSQSCRKYEEGAMVSIYTKRMRITNKWKIAKASLNENDLTSIYSSWILEFTNQGTVVSTINSEKHIGSWQLNNSKNDFDIRYEDSLGFESNEILKLENKAFTYRNKISNIKFELTPF